MENIWNYANYAFVYEESLLWLQFALLYLRKKEREKERLYIAYYNNITRMKNEMPQ